MSSRARLNPNQTNQMTDQTNQSTASDAPPSPSFDEWHARARNAHAEMMAMKERLLTLADAFNADASSHRKLSDRAETELTRICHLSAWDAYKNAERRVMDAVHYEAAF
jgi:hypothetical protein